MRRLGWLLAALILVPCSRSTAEEHNPRLDRFRTELRAAILRLSSEEETERLAALGTVRDALHWKGSYLLKLEPPEEAAMAQGALAASLAVLAHSATDGSGRLALSVLARLCAHSPTTRGVVSGRLDDLDPLFGRVDRRGLAELLDALGLLGAPADPLTPRVVAILHGSDRPRARTAGMTLGLIGGPRARAALATAFAHERIDVREHAYRGWRFLSTVTPAEVRSLLAGLAVPDVAAAALESALHIRGRIQGDAEDVDALLSEIESVYLASEDARTRRAALALIRASGSAAKARAGVVAEVLREDPDRYARLEAAETLAAIDKGSTAASAILAAIEAPPNADVQRALIHELRGVRFFAKPLVPRLQSVATSARSAENESVAYAAESMIREIERQGIRLVARTLLTAGADRVRCLAWSPAGNRIAAGSADRTLRLWQPDRPDPLASNVLPRYG